jgi:hypothetical protein
VCPIRHIGPLKKSNRLAFRLVVTLDDEPPQQHHNKPCGAIFKNERLYSRQTHLIWRAQILFFQFFNLRIFETQAPNTSSASKWVLTCRNDAANDRCETERIGNIHVESAHLKFSSHDFSCAVNLKELPACPTYGRIAVSPCHLKRG